MWAQLGAMLTQLGAMLAYLEGYVGRFEAFVGRSGGLCWPMLTRAEPKDPKNGNSKKNAVKRRIF